MGSEIRLGPCRPCSKAPGLGAVSPHRSEPQWAEKGPPRTFTLTHVHAPSGTNFPPRLGEQLGDCLHQPPSAALAPEARWCEPREGIVRGGGSRQGLVPGGGAGGSLTAGRADARCQGWGMAKLTGQYLPRSWIDRASPAGRLPAASGSCTWPGPGLALRAPWWASELAPGLGMEVSWGGLRPRQPGHLRWLSQLLPPCPPGLACTPPGTANPMGPILLTPPWCP